MEKTKLVNFRLDVQEWDNFLINCRKEKKTGSKKLRNFIKRYNKNKLEPNQ